MLWVSKKPGMFRKTYEFTEVTEVKEREDGYKVRRGKE
jgi:hypothetical protein